MPGKPPASTNRPAAFVPPVPSTVSPPVHGGVLGMHGTAASQISMQVFGVGRGWPVPLTRIEPAATPPVMAGATGAAVVVALGVAVTLGVCVGVAVGVAVGVLVGVPVGVCVDVAVGVCVGVSVGVDVGVCVGVTVGVD